MQSLRFVMMGGYIIEWICKGRVALARNLTRYAYRALMRLQPLLTPIRVLKHSWLRSTVTNIGLAYGGTINPVHDSQFDSESATGGDGMKLLPPRTRRPPGRPQKSRILSAGEFRGSRIFKRCRACTRCGRLDHNRATCRIRI
ncbi:unnamed protein product [Brassica rapa subsp. trilocularis]